MSSATTDLLEPVQQELQRLERTPFRRLSFAPALEDRYEKQFGTRKTALTFRAGMLGLALFNLVLMGDWVMVREHFLTAALVRLLIVTPIVWLLFRYVRSNPGRIKREGCTALAVWIVCCASLYLGFGNERVFSIRAAPGVLIALIFAVVIFRLAPRITAVLLAAAWVLNLGMMIFYYHFPDLTWIGYSIGFTFCYVLLFFGSYLTSHMVRRLFLLQLRGEIQAELMARHNSELRELSERDELTGLGNRYLYERRLDAMFAEAMKAKAPISVVMVDVDHFKEINDTHGHSYGDRVLQRVGALIKEALREEGDFAARYGGEEFVVLLSHVGLDVAAKVAERIRNLVEIAGSPASAKSTLTPEGFTTISCGVASTVPSAGQNAQSLVDAADRALYQAKALGRNRICAVEALMVA